MVICVEAEKAMLARLDDDERKTLDSLLDKYPRNPRLEVRRASGHLADRQQTFKTCERGAETGFRQVDILDLLILLALWEGNSPWRM